MKKILAFICILTLSLTLVGCNSKNQNTITNHANYDGCELILNDNATIETLDNNTKVVKIEAKYINSNEEPLYAYSSFSVRAFQNDTELQDISDINGENSSLIQEISNNNEITVSYTFKITDESSVKILIGEPTSDQTTIGQKTYFESE